jgi:hypothetical protein
MSQKFLVIYEDMDDFEMATGLADRLLCDRIAWIDEEVLHDYREWIWQDDSQRRFRWSEMDDFACEAKIPAVRGKFQNQSGEPDARAVRQALNFIKLKFREQLAGVILVRDRDRMTSRRRGFEQAITEFPDFRVIICIPIIMREAWILSGFVPKTDAEADILASLRQELGFDPTLQSDKLDAVKDANKNLAKKNPKRVLRILTEDDESREAECWRSTPWDKLKENGKQNGLTAYLNDLEIHFLPLFEPSP